MKPRWFFCALLLLITARLALAQNQVLDLDGQGSYVQLPAHLCDGLEEATVEAWVKWEDWAYFSQWFASGTNDQWRAMGLNHFAASSNLQFFLYPGRVEGLSLVRLPVDLPLGHWCHMAAVSGRGGMRLYLNGVLAGSNSFEGSFATISPGENNYLGRSNWRDNAFFHGQLDEVRVWSVARSGEQIRAGMHQRLSGREEGLVALWDFDQGDGRDSAPHGYHGQLRAARPPGDAVVHHLWRGDIALGRPEFHQLHHPGRPAQRVHQEYPPGPGRGDVVRDHRGPGALRRQAVPRLHCPGRSAAPVHRPDLPGRRWPPVALHLWRGLALRRPGIPHPSPPGAFENARTMHQDPSRVMWFGTAGQGLVRYDGHSFTNVTARDSLPGGYIEAIHQDTDGTLWLGTWGEGLVRYDGQAWKAFTTQDGLASNHVREPRSVAME